MLADEFIKNIHKTWEDDLLPKMLQNAISELKSLSFEINFSKNEIKDIPNDYGVYLFQICPRDGNKIEDFIQLWNSDDLFKYTPRISKSRIAKSNNNENKNWYPLYVGKAERLSNRINEHCFQDKNKPTYGLKLKERENLRKKVKIRYSYYKIADKENPNKKAIQFVMTNLESAIRDELNPWIGKQ